MLQQGHSACAGSPGRAIRMALGVRILGCGQLVFYWDTGISRDAFLKIYWDPSGVQGTEFIEGYATWMEPPQMCKI